MTKSMTEGRPLGLILQFAVPLLVGNLLQQLYNIVDAAIVGRKLGPDALASVGASSSVQFLVLGFCIGVCCGFGIPIAKSFGADKLEEMKDYIFHAILLAAVIAVCLTAVCALLCNRILHILSTPTEIYRNAYQYLLILFLGIPFTILYNLCSAILRAVGDSKTPFVFLAVSTILNVVLDLFFIVVLKSGCAGAAMATITAQAVSGILCVCFIKKSIPVLHLSRRNLKIKGRMIRTMLGMGLPMGLQYSITAIGTMVMQSANNGLGSVYISGFTAAMRIKQFMMCPFDAIATAVSVFCGQNLGAGKTDRIKKGLRQGVCVGVAYGVFAGLVSIFAGRTLSMIFISEGATTGLDVSAVLDAAAKYLRCLGFFYWSLGFLNICRMSTQGLGYSGRTIFSGIAEMVARIFVTLVFVPVYGFDAICFTDQTAWLAACIYIVPVCLVSVKKVAREAAAGLPES